jgi:sulfate permease, SulP family
MSTAATLATAPPRPTAGSRIRIGDLWGGLAAMLVAFPSAIAFGVVIFTAASPELASAGAIAGIIGAVALGITAPLVGRNAGFITAPCAPAAAVMSGLATELVRRGNLPLARVLALMALTALLGALFQIVYGLVRAGRLIKFIPYQVVSGYLSGVAVIIAVAQIPKLLGVPSKMHFGAALTAVHLWNMPGVIVGVVTIAVMALAPKVTKAVPGAIIGLAGGIGTYFVVALIRPELMRVTSNPLVIGPIRASGSFLEIVSGRAGSLATFRPSDIALVLSSALTLSVLLSIDTLKTGVVLDALTRQRHNSNRELIAQGTANAASFFAGGVPGAGAMGPSLVNVTSGGKTPWSGVIEGALVLACFLALGNFIAWVPIAALAGILLVVAWRMFDFHMFRLLLRRSTRLDFVIIAVVIIVAETVGLIQSSVVGVFLAILLFIRNQIRASVILRKLDLREIRSKRRRSPEENAILDEHGSAAVVVQLKDDLFFGTTDQLFTELERDIAERRFLLLDFRRVQSMDYTAGHMFLQMQQRLKERGGQLLFSGMPSSLPSRQDIEHYMGQLGLVGSSEGIRIFETRDSALEWMEEQILEATGWSESDADPPLELNEMTLLRNLDAETVKELAKSVRSVSIASGDKLFGAGQPGDELFFLRRGRIHVLLPLEGGKRHHLATFGRGEFFGEMAFLDEGPRSAIAEAATPSEVFVLSRKEFDEIVRQNGTLAADVFEQLALAIAQRLRTTDAEVRALEER